MLTIYFLRVPVCDIDGELWFPVSAVGRQLDYKQPRKNAMRTLVSEDALKTISAPLLRQGKPVCLISLEGLRQWCARVQARRRLKADELLKWVSEEMPSEMQTKPYVKADWYDASADCAEKSQRALRTRLGREQMKDEFAKSVKGKPWAEVKDLARERFAEIDKWRSE